jgi:hypothetical protein
MSQRYFGRPLARESDFSLAATVVAATTAAVLIAAAIDPEALDALTVRAVAAILAAPAVTTLLFAGPEVWKLLAHIRSAEAAGSVMPPDTDPPPRPGESPADHAGVALVIAALFTVISLVGGAAFCVGFAGIVVGRACGSALAAQVVHRHERRLGRRYYRTVGEPEKVVWLGASGLE